MTTLKDQVIAALKTVYDPEMPVNIYELGLIYGLDVKAEGYVDIRMTLTAPNCPVAGSVWTSPEWRKPWLSNWALRNAAGL